MARISWVSMQREIAAVFQFETSPLFNDVQLVVLRVAWHGALQPNAVTDEDFETLKAHFQIARSSTSWPYSRSLAI